MHTMHAQCHTITLFHWLLPCFTDYYLVSLTITLFHWLYVPITNIDSQMRFHNVKYSEYRKKEIATPCKCSVLYTTPTRGNCNNACTLTSAATWVSERLISNPGMVPSTLMVARRASSVIILLSSWISNPVGVMIWRGEDPLAIAPRQSSPIRS